MAVDIRANVTCNLGRLISGTISDDYIQGNGLIKTKGSCEFAEILTPTPGDVVTFKYGSGGNMADIPRKLRVLSSFADPLRNTTKVELGCKLTYLEDLGPTPSEDGLSKSEFDARRQQCLNGYLEYPRDSVVPPPIKASAVMEECLGKLKISAGGNPLTNVYMVDKFDLSPGYVSVLSDLLLAESYCGFLDDKETLQIVELSKESGNGPRINQSLLIDIGPIGVGDLPAEAVLVRFEGLMLEGDVDPSDTSSQAQRDWEEEEVIGDPEEYPVRYTDADGKVVNLSYQMVPYSKVITQYGENSAWDDTQCYISGKEGVDLSDKPIKRTTKTRTIKAQAASNYCAQVLSANTSVDPEPGLIGEQRSEIEYEYDEKGELKRSVESTYQPFYMWAGGLDVDFVYSSDIGDSVVTLGAGDVLTERVVTDYENIYAPQPKIIFLKEGEEYEPLVVGQKVTTTRYLNWALTQQGQQAIASIKDDASFNTASECSQWLDQNSGKLVQDDCQVQTNRGRTTAGGQVRPGKADRVINAKGKPSGSSVAKLVYASGNASAERTLVLSMPYQSTPYFAPDGKAVPGDGESKAIRYGRVQNRLLLGNRYGVSIQMHPRKMPKSPFDPFYLEIGTLSVQYRANAATWAFSADGVIASMDALFWGTAGGTVSSGSGGGGSGGGSGGSGSGGGTNTATKPWVPLPPGNVQLPPLPVPDADGNIDVPSLVPPWIETVPLLGRTRTRLVVKSYPYAVGGTTETVSLVTRTNLAVGYRLAADAGSFALAGTAQPIKLRAGAGSFVLSGLPAGSLGSRVWRVNGATFNVLGQDANKIRTYAPLTADVASFVLDGKPAGKFKGTAIKADVGSFLLSGNDAAKARVFSLPGSAGSFTATGQNASLGIPDPFAGNVVLLLHMDGSNGNTVFVDESNSANAVTAIGSAAVTNAQSKFGTGSLAGVGGSGATSYLSVADSASLEFASGNFTVELFVRFTSVTSIQGLASKGSTGSGDLSWALFRDAFRGTLQFVVSTNGSSDIRKEASWAPTTGVWYHVAVTRSSNNLRFFVNGVLLDAPIFADENLYSGSASVRIGWASNFGLDGFIDEVRFTKGVARYTSNFTPPAAAFSDP